MKHTSFTHKLRRWEAALLLGVALAALLGAVLDRQQQDLAGRLVRLHVLANSDSPQDQALKLQVRDAVLAEAQGLIPDSATPGQARAALAEALPQLAQAGADAVAAAGYDYPVTASLEDGVWFPTRTYSDFALPAGAYTALRLSIGAGEGQNWWCVVFPPLCLGSVSETVNQTAAQTGLDEEQTALIIGDGQGYVVKFKLMELVEEAKAWLAQAAKRD